MKKSRGTSHPHGNENVKDSTRVLGRKPGNISFARVIFCKMPRQDNGSEKEESRRNEIELSWLFSFVRDFLLLFFITFIMSQHVTGSVRNKIVE